MRRTVVPAVCLAVCLSACSGGDGDAGGDGAGSAASPTTISGATTNTSATTVPTVPATSAAPSVAADPLFPSVSGFVAAFVGVGESGATQGAAAFPLTLDGLVTGPLASGGDGFISVDAIPNGLIGGTSDADGAVTAVFVFLDPLAASAAPAVISLLGTTIATPAEFDQAAFAQEYRALALESSARAGDQVWTPSTNGSGHSIVTSVIDRTDGGGSLIEVAIVPYGDEAAAKAAVKPIRNEVIGLVDA